MLEIIEYNSTIQVKTIAAGYVKNGNMDIRPYVGKYSVYETQFDAWRNYLNVPSTDTMGATSAKDFTFRYSRPPASSFAVPSSFRNAMVPEIVEDASQLGYEEQKTSFAGSGTQGLIAEVQQGWALPTNGVTVVGDGATVRLTKATSVNNTATVRVLPGGELRNAHSSAIGNSQHIILDGGRMVFRDDLSIDYPDTWTLLNFVTFRDGAVLSGAKPRFGSSGIARWTVSGNTPSTCETSIMLVNISNGQTINVLDVTDDADGDFFINGDIDSYSGNAATLRKTGGGALVHGGVCGGERVVPVLRIEQGEWRLAASSPNQTYTLAGGMVSAAAGRSVSAGALAVASGGGICVPAGASISFADSSAQSWGGTDRVIVSADLASDSVRFGESGSGLSTAQITRMRTSDGCRVTLDGSGWLRAKSKTFSITIK